MRTRRSHNSINGSVLSAALILIAITVSLVAASFAWFASLNHVSNDQHFTAETIAGYFADGDGSQGDPYIINNPRHLYNLAWLQDRGAITKYTYFKLGADIDMAGMLGGEDGAPAGAIPPIGTNDNPFVGHFDGQGHVISNLWVSTNPDHWKEKPQGMNEYISTHVGLFGAVGKDAAGNGAIIENFVLDRVEITCDIDATVGIICGYVGAMVNDRGVYNGNITASNGATCKSNYSILGEKGEGITWVGGPVLDAEHGGPVGDLVVDPTDRFSTNPNRFTGVEEGELLLVPGAVNNNAYYVGELSATSADKGTNFWEYKNGQPNRFTVDSSSSKSKLKINEIWENYSSNDVAIEVVEPDFSIANAVQFDVNNTPDKDEDDIYLPANSIWFTPQCPGVVSMVFSVSNNSNTRYAALYICERVDGYLQVVEKKEFSYVKDKNSKKGDLFYYEYEITQDEYDEHYEYVIGGSSGRYFEDFFFNALVLAGTSPDSEAVTPPTEGQYSDTIYSVDYVTEEFLNSFIEIETDVRDINFSTIHMTLLHINEFTASGDYKFYYNAMNDDGKVHYYDPAGHIEDYSRDKEATLDNNMNNYQVRDPGGTQTPTQ